MKTKKSKLSGFTFVEVLIIVVIVGLLAVMAVPAFQQVRMQEQKRKILINLEHIVTLGQTYLNAEHVEHVAYEELVAKGYLQAVPSIAGENYDGVVVQKDKGTIEVKYNEYTISYHY